MRTTYGSFDDPGGDQGDLIDLKSGRNDMNPAVGGFSTKYDLETASELITPCPSISLGTTFETDPDTGTETGTTKTAAMSLYDVSGTASRSPPSRDLSLGSLSIILIIIWTLLLSILHPSSLSLSAPLSRNTPLAVACVLPPPPLTLMKMVHHSQMVAGRSKLLVWPSTDLAVLDDDDVERMVDWVHREVTARYGVWVMMSLESEIHSLGIRVVMVGPEGEVDGALEFRDREARPGGQWTVNLAP